MTEIRVTDEAWRQAEETWNEHINCGNGPEKALRAALTAAAPLLQVQGGGDGGLREALEKLAKERDSVNGSAPSDYVPQPAGVGEAIASAIEDAADERADAAGMPAEGYYAAAKIAREFAVPQPVDRRELLKLLESEGVTTAHVMDRGELAYRQELADKVLALLKGSEVTS